MTDDPKAEVSKILKRMKAKRGKRQKVHRESTKLPSEGECVGHLRAIIADGGPAGLAAIKFILTAKYNWTTPAPAGGKTYQGKKEAANIAAETAHEDSEEWRDIIN